MPTVTKATSRKRSIAKVTKAAQKTPLPGDPGPIKRGTPAHLKVPQFDPKASAKQDAQDAQDAKPVTEHESKVDDKTKREIGVKMVEYRKAYTRGLLATESGLTPSVIWRIEQGRIKTQEEFEATHALFRRIEAGEIEKPQRKALGRVQSGPTKADLVSTIEQVRHILSDVPATGLKVGQAREAISTCLDLIEKTMSSGDE